MLIACMSNTLTEITENVIVEWTFGRTEVRKTIDSCFLTRKQVDSRIKLIKYPFFRLTWISCSRLRSHRHLTLFQRTLVFNRLSSTWKYGWNQRQTSVHDGIHITVFISLVNLAFSKSFSAIGTNIQTTFRISCILNNLKEDKLTASLEVSGRPKCSLPFYEEIIDAHFCSYFQQNKMDHTWFHKIIRNKRCCASIFVL